ncbi:uncharacterized protein BT62DRAFT_921639 [Guyanagaster necrorhizus]|uniref:MYND-type domain-containing protein n=1 Tax=Guyanagaster necrorhizus TaxID=856835 RepID=A0A9P8AQE4_9AGAR|nr:uncharacterized protein BT62DRAFT_921639 [Guyanagaster necrorhizus MCA 3950]KAG7444019.1 hypothetical protein BT62DRAFT_921639 [Guyanagaster necrorhizus MCA 3950]
MTYDTVYVYLIPKASASLSCSKRSPDLIASVRPNKETDRVGWNKSWERDLAFFPAGWCLIPVYQGKPQETLQYLRQSSIHLLDEFNSKTREICTLQRDLVKAVVPAFAHDEFEEKWRGLTQKRKEELVLEGLYVTSCAGPDMENRRWLCPEMTVKALAENNDKDFIQLLKLHLPKDQVKDDLTAPIYLPNAQFKKMMETDPNDYGLRRLVEMNRLERAYFITMTLWSTFNASVRSIVEIRCTQEKAQIVVCYNCKRDEESLRKQGRELLVCEKCKPIGRIIPYCSRDCQIADWKSGFPVPHKDICGKKGCDADEGTPQSDQVAISGGLGDADGAERDTGIPAPDPAFKQPPALLHQISLHTEPDSFVGYVFVRPYPQDDHGVSLGSGGGDQ